MQKYVPFIMYCGNALLLFTQVIACRVIRPYFFANFHTVPLMVFEILGFKLKKNNENDNDKNWRNGLYVNCPIQTTFR